MINEELEKNYNQKIKEMAMKNKNINKVSSRIFEYEQEIKEIKKQIENENQILFLKNVLTNLLCYFVLIFEYRNHRFLKKFYMNLILIPFLNRILN